MKQIFIPLLQHASPIVEAMEEIKEIQFFAFMDILI